MVSPAFEHAKRQLSRAFRFAIWGAAYNDFLTLWKDADPDIPVLIQAKAEYVKLK